MTEQGLSPTRFAAVPIATTLPYVVGGWLLSRRAADQGHVRSLFVAAQLAMAIGCLLLVALGLLGWLSAVAVVAGVSIYAFGLGIVLPVSSADAVRPFPREGGCAGALLSAMQMAAGAAAGLLVVQIGLGPAIAFPGVMLIGVLMSCLSCLL